MTRGAGRLWIAAALLLAVAGVALVEAHQAMWGIQGAYFSSDTAAPAQVAEGGPSLSWSGAGWTALAFVLLAAAVAAVVRARRQRAS